MESPSQHEKILRKLHEEAHRAGPEEAAKRLDSIHGRVNALFTARGASINEARDHTRGQLDSLSKFWEKLEKGTKSERQEALWNQLVDACYDLELESLKQQGYTESAAKQLVRREKAWWSHDSRRIETGSVAPEFEKSVPVVVVQRETGFRIHDEIMAHLWQHPLFVKEFTDARVGGPSDVFMNTLSSVEAIAHDYGFNDWEDVPSYDELEGEDRRALACLLAGLELECALEPIGTESGGFFGDDGSAPGEDLKWLVEAKQGQHLWRLLNTAVKLGRSLNQYGALRKSDVEKAIRKMHTVSPGRRTGPAGTAIEPIISAAKEAGLGHITPKTLLNWLKGKQPHSIDKPLDVTHPLWVTELKDITWKDFENLVKSAGRRSRSE